MGKTSKAVLLAAVAGIAAYSSPSCAQNAAEPASNTLPNKDGERSGIEDIVVTAQRRVERAQDVPISIQVVSAAALANRAIADTIDLANVLPTLNYTAGSASAGSSFSLRGVRSTTLGGGVQPSTALVINGVPVFRQSEFATELADIDHIEILNGPQGTLFGKNSTAGVINIVTQSPKNVFEASVEGSATSDQEYMIRAMVNLPVTQGVRFRVNGYYRNQDPLVHNATGPDVAGRETYGGTAKLAVDLGERASAELEGGYNHVSNTFGQFLIIVPGVLGQQQANKIGVPIGFGQTQVNTDSPAFDISVIKNLTLTFNVHPSDTLTLTSISNITRSTDANFNDFDSTPAGVNIGKGFSDTSGYPYQTVFRTSRQPTDRYTYISQELRANYVTGPINLVVGGYYERVSEFFGGESDSIVNGSLLHLAPGHQYFSGVSLNSYFHDETAAAFADLTLKVASSLKLFGGLRYTYEKIDVDYNRKNYLFDLASNAFNPVSGAINDSIAAPTSLHTVSTQSQNNVSGRAGIQVEPSRHLNFYASYAHGYKAPAADLGGSLLPGVDPIIKPETSDDFELGAKTQFFRAHLVLNVGLFHQTIDNLQQTTVPPGSTMLTSQLLNVGALRINGVETEAHLLVTENLRLNTALAYNDATYRNFSYNCNSTQTATATCPNSPRAGFQDLAGTQAIGAPRWKYNVGATYTGQIARGRYGYLAEVNYVWRSQVNYQLDQSPFTNQAGYGLLDATIGLTSPHDRWELRLFVKNLTNKFFYSGLQSVGIVANELGYISHDYHRYGGLSFKVKI